MALLAIGLAPASAEAADAPAFDVTGWRVDCSSKDPRVLDCEAIDRVVLRGTNQQLVVMTVRIPADTKQPTLLIQVPLGIAVSNGITLTVGTAAAEPLPIQTCTQGGCFAGRALPEKTLDEMRSSTQLRVAFSTLEKQTTTVTLPLTGFAACYDKLK